MQTNIPASVKAFLARVGEGLKEAREAQGLSREDVCRNLKMHIHSVIALEEGIYEDLPGAAFFFAALRSYARFLKLDADKIVAECKRNKFLFEGLQGEGTIQRKDTVQEFNEPDIVKHMPSSLQKLDLQRDPTKRRPLELDEPTSKEEKPPKKRKGGFLAFLASLLAGLLVAFVIIAALLYAWMNFKFAEGPLKEDIRKELNSLQLGLFKGQPCGVFRLVATQKVAVKITALSLGQTILDREMDINEELSFSDTEGIKIEVADPDSLKLTIGQKELPWSDLQDKKQIQTYVYRCQ